jgi:IS5 family transposase
MLRIHFLRKWFNLSDPAMEEALLDFLLFNRVARFDAGAIRLPD